MKEIELTQGRKAIVDDDDFERINKFKWYSHIGKGYAARGKRKIDGKWKLWYLHWDIIGKPKDGFVMDHINGNILDNRKENLRIVTPSQNKMNSKKYKIKTSSFKGVSWDKIKKKWVAQIQVRRKVIHLGRFKIPKSAYLAYCNASLKYHKEFGRIN